MLIALLIISVVLSAVDLALTLTRDGRLAAPVKEAARETERKDTVTGGSGKTGVSLIDEGFENIMTYSVNGKSGFDRNEYRGEADYGNR